MVGLDGAALQDVRVDGSLGQEFNPRQLPGFLLKDPDELCADDLPFGLRVGHPGQLVQETVHRVDIDQVGIHLVAEHLDHLFRFSLPQQAVVYMDAGELLTHRLDQQGGYHRRVHPAGQGQQDLFVPDLFLKCCHLFLNERFCQSGGGDPLHGFRALVVCHIPFLPRIHIDHF